MPGKAEMIDNSYNITDFDDLVFELRNRDYGAYQLRKKYNSALVTGIVAAVFIACCVVLIPFLGRKEPELIVVGGSGRPGYVSVQMDVLEPPEEQFYVPPAPPPPPPRQAESMQEEVRYVPPVVVDSLVTFQTTIITTDQALAQTDEGDLIETIGSGFGDDLFGLGGGSDMGEPFYIVETMPSFRGGDLNKFRDWVQKRTNYPPEAIEKKIEGKVYLTFIVESDGSVSNVTVVQGVDPLIDDEAVKAIEGSPRWSPGLQRGQPVRVRYAMALNFDI